MNNFRPNGLTLLFGLVFSFASFAQMPMHYTTAHAHSHNDYEQHFPFWQAYFQQFGSIEVDVHAKNGQLLVGHDATDLRSDRSFEAL